MENTHSSSDDDNDMDDRGTASDTQSSQGAGSDHSESDLVADSNDQRIYYGPVPMGGGTRRLICMVPRCTGSGVSKVATPWMEHHCVILCARHRTRYLAPADYRLCRRCQRFKPVSEFTGGSKTCNDDNAREEHIRPCVLVVPKDGIRLADGRVRAEIYKPQLDNRAWMFISNEMVCTPSAAHPQILPTFVAQTIGRPQGGRGLKINWRDSVEWPLDCEAAEYTLTSQLDPEFEGYKVMFVLHTHAHSSQQELFKALQSATRTWQGDRLPVISHSPGSPSHATRRRTETISSPSSGGSSGGYSDDGSVTSV